MLRRPSLLLLVLAVLGGFLVRAVAGSESSLRVWSTYGGDPQSTNNAADAVFTAASARRLKLRWARKLDGTVYAPVLLSASGGVRRLLVATEANSVYALDPATGRLMWRHSLGAPAQTVCGSFGVTSAPGLDASRGRLYVVGADGLLRALSMSTGTPVSGWSVRIVSRTTVDYVWSSVRLVGNLAYVATASYCDKPDLLGRAADGHIYAVDVRTHRIVHRFDIVAGRNNLGGAWGWGGVSVDATNGTLYTATGNSAISLGGDLIEDEPYAERVVHLSPTLKVLGSSLPPRKSPANLGDEDFGSTPLLFQPEGCPPLLAVNSKDGRVLVYRRDRLDAPIWSAAIGPTNPRDPFLGQPSWDAATQQLVIAQAEFGSGTDPSKGVVAYRPASGCSRFTSVWHDNIGGGPIPAPLIAGGLVFALAQANGTVYGIDRTNGANVWSARTGRAVAPPATDGRRVYIASVDGIVHAFG